MLKLNCVLLIVSFFCATFFLFFARDIGAVIGVFIPDDIKFGRGDPIFCIAFIWSYFFLFFLFIQWLVVGIYFIVKKIGAIQYKK